MARGQGVEKVSNPNLGGTVEFDWGSVRLVPALHTTTTPDGTPGGVTAGLVIEIGGKSVYHLGDTAVFSDLRLIGEVVDGSPADLDRPPRGRWSLGSCVRPA